MYTSNKKLFIFFRITLLLLLLIIVVDFLIASTPGRLSSYFENHSPAIIAGSIIVILAFVRVNYFKYEDEYEIIHITSKSLLFGRFSDPANTRYEFPKRLVTDFEYRKSLVQKTLVIHLQTENGTKRIRKFDLSFVPLKKTNVRARVFRAYQEK
jgi:hypothetical protein